MLDTSIEGRFIRPYFIGGPCLVVNKNSKGKERRAKVIIKEIHKEDIP
jgi:hypothetical protein